jgi:hypothetical protein
VEQEYINRSDEIKTSNSLDQTNSGESFNLGKKLPGQEVKLAFAPALLAAPAVAGLIVAAIGGGQLN